MGDSIEDSFDNSDGEVGELEKPRTPDFHDGRHEDEESFSDVSDDRANEQQGYEDIKESSVEAEADSPDSGAAIQSPERENVEDTKEVEDEEVSETSEQRKDLEGSKDEGAEQEEKESRNDDVSEEKSIPDIEHLKEQKESKSTENSTSQQEMSEQTNHNKTNAKDNAKDGNDDEDEDLEIPLSPIGDLGLSEPEAAIVDDILKGDVSEMMPGHNDNVRKSVIDDDDLSDKDVDQEAKSSPVMDDGDDNDNDDNTKEANSEDMDNQDDERSEPEEAGNQLIADIFGASDEEEEFEGFDQEDIEVSKTKQVAGSKRPSKAIISDEEEEEEEEGETSKAVDEMVVPKPKDKREREDYSDDEVSGERQVWDFDVMMEQKKASRSRRRKKGDGDLISDNDDLVVEMIKQMQQAAEEDRMLNEAKQAATKKLKLLPVVLKHLNKADLQFTFIDSGILNGIKEWLSPLPDGSLPHLQIRTGLLTILSAFPALDTGALKMSGLGKSVMYLFRHPKEIRKNKDKAGKLINEWARPIFGVTSNFKSMSREEREERDYQNMSKRRRLSSADEPGNRTPRSIDRALHGEKKAARPGEKGFVMRARVPAPSNKDYVVRPKSNMDNIDFRSNSTNVLSRVDKQMRRFKERNKSKEAARITISIEGRKMAL